MKKLIVLILFFSVLLAKAQKHPEHKRANNWCFGWNAGLCFNSGSAVALTNVALMQGFDGCSTISDTSGNLLMYSNGEKIWNRNNQVMLNGYNLNGCISSANGTLLVPQPGNDSLYYLFTADCWENYFSGLYYSVINIKGDGGLGQVITKNVLLLDSCAESVIATYAAEGNIWIVTSDIKGMFYSYLLSNTGISGVVDSMQTTSMLSYFPSYQYSFGYLKFSPNGNYIFASDFVDLGDGICKLISFDICSGNFITCFTIAVDLDPIMHFYYSSFSYDSRYLYIQSRCTNGPCLPSAIVYYEISEPIDSAAIVNSMDTLISTNYVQINAMQLSPLGNIVISTSTTAVTYNYVSTFADPNNPNPANLFLNSIYLGGKEGRMNLINTIETWFLQDTIMTNPKNKESTSVFEIFPNPTDGSFIVLTDTKGCWDYSIRNVFGEIAANGQNCSNELLVNQSLLNGVYFFEITDNIHHQKKVKKVLIKN